MWVVESRRSRPASRRAIVRVAGVAFVLVVVYAALQPWLARAAVLDAAAAATARLAAWIFGVLGLAPRLVGSTIVTAHGSYLVTPECVLTPAMPIYLAVVLTMVKGWRGRTLGLMAFAPVFATLALARLMTLAIAPLAGDQRLVFTHAFYQFLAAGAVLVIAASWGGERLLSRSSVRRAALAAALGLGFGVCLGPAYSRVVEASAAWAAAVWGAPAASLAGAGDVQGAVALFPAFQLALLLALCAALERRPSIRRLTAGAGVLLATQVIVLIFIGVLVEQVGVDPPVVPIRAWTLVAPIAVACCVCRAARWSREIDVTPPASPSPSGSSA
jgi:hypothetical protein